MTDVNGFEMRLKRGALATSNLWRSFRRRFEFCTFETIEVTAELAFTSLDHLVGAGEQRWRHAGMEMVDAAYIAGEITPAARCKRKVMIWR